MSKAVVWYTVLCDHTGYPVKYLDVLTWRVQTFPGPFGDPGEASQEFKACVGGQSSEYLTPRRFEATVQELLRLREADEHRLSTWNAASRARHNR